MSNSVNNSAPVAPSVQTAAEPPKAPSTKVQLQIARAAGVPVETVAAAFTSYPKLMEVNNNRGTKRVHPEANLKKLQAYLTKNKTSDRKTAEKAWVQATKNANGAPPAKKGAAELEQRKARAALNEVEVRDGSAMGNLEQALANHEALNSSPQPADQNNRQVHYSDSSEWGNFAKKYHYDKHLGIFSKMGHKVQKEFVPTRDATHLKAIQTKEGADATLKAAGFVLAAPFVGAALLVKKFNDEVVPVLEGAGHTAKKNIGYKLPLTVSKEARHTQYNTYYNFTHGSRGKQDEQVVDTWLKQQTAVIAYNKANPDNQIDSLELFHPEHPNDVEQKGLQAVLEKFAKENLRGGAATKKENFEWSQVRKMPWSEMEPILRETIDDHREQTTQALKQSFAARPVTEHPAALLAHTAHANTMQRVQAEVAAKQAEATKAQEDAAAAKQQAEANKAAEKQAKLDKKASRKAEKAAQPSTIKRVFSRLTSKRSGPVSEPDTSSEAGSSSSSAPVGEPAANATPEIQPAPLVSAN